MCYLYALFRKGSNEDQSYPPCALAVIFFGHCPDFFTGGDSRRFRTLFGQ
jgi:hypothetical protein